MLGSSGARRSSSEVISFRPLFVGKSPFEETLSAHLMPLVTARAPGYRNDRARNNEATRARQASTQRCQSPIVFEHSRATCALAD